MAQNSKVRLTNLTRRPVPVDNGVEIPAMDSIVVASKLAEKKELQKLRDMGDLRIDAIAEDSAGDTQPRPSVRPAKGGSGDKTS